MIYVAKRIENEKSLKKINLLFHHEFTSKKDILIVLDGEESFTYLKEGHDISFFGKIVLVFFSKANEKLISLEKSVYLEKENGTNLFITKSNVYFSYANKLFYIGKKTRSIFDFYIDSSFLKSGQIKRFDVFKKENLDYVYYLSLKANSQKEVKGSILNNSDGFLYNEKRELSSLKEDDLPEYYVKIYSSFEFIYLSSLDVLKVDYKVSNCSLFLENDSLEIFYKRKVNEEKLYSFSIYGNGIIDFLLACNKYSFIKQNEVFKAIKKKVYSYNLSHPNNKRILPF